MIRLHVLRHAKSSWEDPGLDDRERPLAPRGERAGAALARWIAASEVRPELVICSPAVRARATLELLLPALGDPSTLVDDGVYGASAADLLARLRELPAELDEVMLVGHEPALSSLLVLLARDGSHRRRIEQKLPTGALATLESEERWAALGSGSMEIVALVLPREL